MKKITWLLSIALMTTLIGCGSMMMGTRAPEEQRRFEKIIDIPNKTKDALYIKVNAWFVETFNSAESVIEFQDKESGKIMGKYLFATTDGVYTMDVKSTISVDVRDNRARIVINDPYYRATSGLGERYVNTTYNPLVTQAGIDKARLRWEILATELTDYLNNNSDEW